MNWPNDIDPREAFLAHMYSGDEDNGDEITSGFIEQDDNFKLDDDYDGTEEDEGDE